MSNFTEARDKTLDAINKERLAAGEAWSANWAGCLGIFAFGLFVGLFAHSVWNLVFH